VFGLCSWQVPIPDVLLEPSPFLPWPMRPSTSAPRSFRAGRANHACQCESEVRARFETEASHGAPPEIPAARGHGGRAPFSSSHRSGAEGRSSGMGRSQPGGATPGPCPLDGRLPEKSRSICGSFRMSRPRQCAVSAPWRGGRLRILRPACDGRTGSCPDFTVGGGGGGPFRLGSFIRLLKNPLDRQK